MEMERSKARIYFDDGTKFVRKKDGLVIEITDSFIDFIDTYDNIRQIIPLSRVYRIIFLKEGNNDRQ